jgi:hypothetical protein
MMPPHTRDKLDESEVKSCVGYQIHASMVALFVILTVASGGLLLLICYWKPHWRLRLTAVPCQLCNAKIVLLENKDGDMFVEEIITEDLDVEQGDDSM